VWARIRACCDLLSDAIATPDQQCCSLHGEAELNDPKYACFPTDGTITAYNQFRAFVYAEKEE
jgi:hypothetical protein